MNPEPQVSYSLKELFEGVNQRLDKIDGKLDRELEHLEKRVGSLETFRSRFLPTSIVVILLMAIGLILDIFVRYVA